MSQEELSPHCELQLVFRLASATVAKALSPDIGGQSTEMVQAPVSTPNFRPCDPIAWNVVDEVDLSLQSRPPFPRFRDPPVKPVRMR